MTDPIAGARQHLQRQLQLLLVSIQFLTRVPVPARLLSPFDSNWLNACVAYFPLTGAIIGLLGAAVLTLASAGWPPFVAVSLAVFFTVWLTGAFHEDGLADTFDGLGGVVSRERSLQIMKDSRIGTYGAVALVFSLSVRIALLSALASEHIVLAMVGLVASQTLGRSAAVGVMSLLPYAGDVEHAKAKPLAVSVPRIATIAAMLWSLIIVTVCIAISCAAGIQITPFGALSISRWLTVLLVTTAVVFVMRRWLSRRLGGYTGDTLGATEQIGEISVLLTLAFQWRALL